VLSEGAVVEVVIASTQGGAVLTADGESVAELREGDSVVSRANDALSHFVRLRERNYFYRSLLDRMEPRVNNQASSDGHVRRTATRKSQES
jgi:NAD+ kinase